MTEWNKCGTYEENKDSTDGGTTMLSLLLIGLIAIAGIIASISLSDSALKWHHAHSALRIELAQAQNA
ncbi:MAG: hypothetical protein EP341_10915, partial [Sphingomonadales bacterium]